MDGALLTVYLLEITQKYVFKYRSIEINGLTSDISSQYPLLTLKFS